MARAVLEVELPTYPKLIPSFHLLFLCFSLLFIFFFIFFIFLYFLLLNTADRNVRSKRAGIAVGSKAAESSDLVLATFVEMQVKDQE